MLFLKNKILLTAIITAVFISLLHIIFCYDVYDDIAAYYGQMATAFARGDWRSAFDLSVPVFSSTLGGLLTSAGIESFRALVIVSCIFYVVSIFPLYYILKFFLKEEDLAAWGCVLYVVAPKIIRYGCTGLLNPAKNFLIIAAFALILASKKDVKWHRTVMLGAVLAGLALARAETFVFVPFLVIFYAFFIWSNKKENNKKAIIEPILHCAVITLLFFLFVSPRLMQAYLTTGAPVLDIRQAIYFLKIIGQEAVKYNSSLIIEAHSTIVITNSKYPDGWRKIISGLDSFVLGAYIPYLTFAVLGFIVWWKKHENRIAGYMLLGILLVNTSVVIFIVNSVRYYSIVLVLLLPFTVLGLKFILDLLPKKKYLKYIVIIIFAAVAVLQILNGAKKAISRKYDYEYQSGLMLKSLKPEGKRGIIASEQPQYAFWADSQWMRTSENKAKFLEQLNQIKSADFLVIDSDNEDLKKILSGEKEFTLLEHKAPKLCIYSIKKDKAEVK